MKILIDRLKEIELVTKDPEEIFTTTGVSWSEYTKLIDRFTDSSKYRITYLDGTLVIISPSRSQEIIKKNLARLLEVYFEIAGIYFLGLGSTTLRKEENQAGKEPDECYCIGSEKEFPDLAIEISITSGGIDTLETYKRLNIPEVWIWKNNKLTIYTLKDSEYINSDQSVLLPNLDIQLLERLTLSPSPLEAIKEFRDSIIKE